MLQPGISRYGQINFPRHGFESNERRRISDCSLRDLFTRNGSRTTVQSQGNERARNGPWRSGFVNEDILAEIVGELSGWLEEERPGRSIAGQSSIGDYGGRR